MKFKNVIQQAYEQEEKKESKHIEALKQQILVRVRQEKTQDEEIKSFFPVRKFIWTPQWIPQFSLAFAMIMVIVVCFSIVVNTPVSAKSPIIDALISLRNALQQELTHLLGTDPTYRDKSTQKYKQAQQEWCSVSARSPEEQEKAVAAVREFLDRPDADVKYECIKNPSDNAAEQASTEIYTVDFDQFIVDSKTNFVTEMTEKVGKWGENRDGSKWTSPQKPLDYTPRYDKTDAEQLAREFITNHEKALGKIELSKLTLESNQKDDGSGKVNFIITWKGEPQTRKITQPYKTCSKDVKPEDATSYDENGIPCVMATEDRFTPQISITFTQGGQLISFFNELTHPEK